MQQCIDRLLEGKFEYEKGSLEFSSTKIELNLRCHEQGEGSFVITGAKKQFTEGMVYSSNPRMKCLNPNFIGNNEEIFFTFDSEGMREGDVVRGEFDIVSNQGEYYIPFVVSVQYEVLQSSIGPIKNLFHFTNLAKTNWAEAVSLFYCPDFTQIFKGSDKQHLTLYRGLSANQGNEHNIEEFLVQIKKKQKIEYLIEETSVRMEDPQDMTQGIVSITRNGWGYTCLEVQSEGDFLVLEKNELTDDDFLGNFCHLAYYIDTSRLHNGNNFGRIKIGNAAISEEVCVVVKKNVTDKSRLVTERSKQLAVYQLMMLYQNFRLKKMSKLAWLNETKKLVEKLENADDNDVTVKLFAVHLLITEERYNEAKWMLAQIEKRFEDQEVPAEVYCYYLYLTTLNSRQEAYVDDVTGQVERVFKMEPDNWRIAWLLLFLSESYSRSSSKKWIFLEEQFEHENNSPVLYLEAALLLQANPALLRRMERYEMHVLLYMVKNQVLTEGVVRQILLIVAAMKEYNPLVVKILEACYKYREDENVLQTICSYLIKGNQVSGRAFKWYKRGVEKELRVTQLYEYYMLSMDLNYEEEIPRMVMMYFAYQSDLDVERTAYLYAAVHRNRLEYPEIYEKYEARIERFLMEQIDAKRINRSLAYLYRHGVSPQMIHDGNADKFACLIFTNQYVVSYEKICNVIVLHQNMVKEEHYPVEHRVGEAMIYTNEATVLFEDDRGNRYGMSAAYSTERFLLPGKLARTVMPHIQNFIGLDVYLCNSESSYVVIDAENYMSYDRMIRSEVIDTEFKREASLQLMWFLYDADKIRELDDLLEYMEPENYETKERAEIIKYLVLRGSYDKALDWLSRYDIGETTPKTILRLISRLMEREDFKPSPQMTYLAFSAMEQGKADKNSLDYLISEYEGLVKKLRNIWRSCKNLGVAAGILEEKILRQILYSEAYIGERTEIFQSYLTRAEEEQDAGLIEAFVTKCAYDFFVKEKVTDESVFSQIERFWKSNQKIGKICKLAYVRYYSDKKERWDEERKGILSVFLQDLIEEGIALPFFKEYAGVTLVANRFSDKTMIEYRAHPESAVTIHYLIGEENSEESGYRKELMKHVFDGVFSKEFVLFFGEKLQYYITEERDGETRLTESDAIGKSDIGVEISESRFSRINDITISQLLQDYSTLDTLLEEYYQMDFYVDNLFRLQ